MAEHNPYPVTLSFRGTLLFAAIGASACGGSQGSAAAPSTLSSPSVVRYRLPLHHNPVDPAEALRCYTACQLEKAPEEYLECLKACPGFETTPGIACEPDEVPPRAACFTARQLAPSSEPEPGSIVIGVLAGFRLVVGLASVCASSSVQCSPPERSPSEPGPR